MTNDSAYTVAAGRFYSDVAGCPAMTDSFCTLIAMTSGHPRDASAAVLAPAAALYQATPGRPRGTADNSKKRAEPHWACRLLSCRLRDRQAAILPRQAAAESSIGYPAAATGHPPGMSSAGPVAGTMGTGTQGCSRQPEGRGSGGRNDAEDQDGRAGHGRGYGTDGGGCGPGARGDQRRAGYLAVVDHGQGCWGGGPLNADHTAGGSGACSLTVPGVGHELASIVPETWTFADASDTVVTLCLDVVVKSGPPLISGQACFPVQVTSGAPVVIPQLSPDTYGKVVLAG